MTRRRALRYLAGCAALALIVSFLDLSAIGTALAQIAPLDILVLVLLSFALIAVSVIKWRAFLVQMGVHEGFWKLFGLYLVGYFVNLLMPSFVGGDVVRSLAVGARQDRSAALVSTLLERFTGLAAMLFLASVMMWFSSAVTFEIRACALICVCGFVVTSVAIGFRVVSRVCERLLGKSRFVEKVTRIEDALHHGMSAPKLLWQVAGLSLVFHCLTIVNTAAVAHAVGWDTFAWADLFVVVPLILLVGAVPISPQGLGIQEGAFVFFLSSIGATPAQAFSIGLVLRLKSYLLALLGAGVWMRSGRGLVGSSTPRG